MKKKGNSECSQIRAVKCYDLVAVCLQNLGCATCEKFPAEPSISEKGNQKWAI